MKFITPTPGMKKAIGLGLVCSFILISGFTTNKLYSNSLDKQIRALDVQYSEKLELLNNFHEYEFEGKDSDRIETDISRLNHMFEEIFTFDDGNEFLESKQAALTDYNWNKNFVDEYFDETGLYDADGNFSESVNMSYQKNSSSINLVEVTDDDRYYHYICDIVVYVGNYVMDASAKTHIIADVMMDEYGVGSIYCYNTQ